MGNRTIQRLLVLIVLLLLLTGCQFTQTAFANSTGNAGSAFAAAATTLSYAHQGKITFAYARSSFINYQSELSGLDQSLATMNGAPDRQSIQHLLALYQPAMKVVNQPCLATNCDWQAQITTLQQASDAFQKAGSA